ncbi:MAG: AAA family ATPase [Planctomycetota bacterium]|jgi:hypothetical protein
MSNLSFEFATARVDDRQVLDSVTKAVEATSWSLSQVSVTFPFGGGAFVCSADELAGQNELTEVVESRLALVATFLFRFSGGAKMTVRRGSPEEAVDQVTLNSGNDETPAEFARVVAAVKRNFDAHSPARFVDSVAREGAEHAHEAREAAVVRLEATAAHLLTETEQARKRWEDEHRQKENRLFEQYQQRAAELEADYKNRERQLQERAAQLEAEYRSREKELQARQSQIEADGRDREEQRRRKTAEIDEDHSRREKEVQARENELDRRRHELETAGGRHRLRENLKDKLAGGDRLLRLSRGSRWLRRTISLFNVALVLLFGGAAGHAFYQTVTSTESGVVVLAGINQAVFLLLFVAASYFFLRWHGDWFRRRAEEELRLKRREIELDRVDWLLEAAFEWKEKHGTEIPVDWLDSLLAGGRFTDGRSRRAPADVSASGDGAEEEESNGRDVPYSPEDLVRHMPK